MFFIFVENDLTDIDLDEVEKLVKCKNTVDLRSIGQEKNVSMIVDWHSQL